MIEPNLNFIWVVVVFAVVGLALHLHHKYVERKRDEQILKEAAERNQEDYTAFY